MAEKLRVLYDGWPLFHSPDDPAAYHLLALLHAVPPDVAPILACPGTPPAWWKGEFGPDTSIEIMVSAAQDRLTWEQRKIKALAAGSGARILHLTSGRAPFNSPLPVVISPTDAGRPDTRRKSLRRRLGDALASGGLARASLVLWPADLPAWERSNETHAVPPLTHPAFTPSLEDSAYRLELELPETYILHHGPLFDGDLDLLLSAWTWAAGSIGQLYPLVIAGAGHHSKEGMLKAARQMGLEETVQFLPPLPPRDLAEVYRRCTAIFHPAPVTPWGSPVRRGLAAGRALVLIESPLADATVGPAACVLPAADTRRLGAALITTVVEEEVRERLEVEARKRAAGWKMRAFGQALYESYQSIL